MNREAMGPAFSMEIPGLSLEWWKPWRWWMGVCLAFAMLGPGVPAAPGNVFASHIRLERLPEGSGGGVAIRYILNEPATAGVVIEVWDGSQVVRTLAMAGGEPGTFRGENQVMWDGRDGQGVPVCCGVYRVRITAAAQGFADWTQISDDFAPGQYVYAPTGIGVVRDPLSPYYGRVLVANGRPGPNAEFLDGDRPGLLKLQADGSVAGEGGWSDGGRSWAGEGDSPGEVEVWGERVYVWDAAEHELVMLDPEASPTSLRVAWDHTNHPTSGTRMTGFAVGTGPGGNWLWMAQNEAASGPGVYGWPLEDDGTVAPGDRGTLAIRAGAGFDLGTAPWDVAVGPNGGLFVIQSRAVPGDGQPRVLAFPAWTNPAAPLESAIWVAGGGQDTMRGATAVAVDPTGSRVAVTFRGVLSGGFFVGGRVMIFDAATGAWVVTLPGVDQEYSDVDWDAVGNLYVANLSESVWRVYSPPGSNAATTLSVATVEIGGGSVRPFLEVVRLEGSGLVLALTAQPGSSYVIEASADLLQWTPVGTVVMGEAARRETTVPAEGPRRFYRARLGP
ncbi:hypothetical protein [Limisphaera sp. 4302-co]|uniref:hypothetical protein n=1 Tax=Limisphaera sp. 4302-co TaxID=3400417 RepID=UPI003C286AEF